MAEETEEEKVFDYTTKANEEGENNAKKTAKDTAGEIGKTILEYIDKGVEAGKRGFECEIKDPTSFVGNRFSSFVSELYNNVIRFVPRLFGLVYRIGEDVDAITDNSPVYYINASYSDKLYKYITDNGFDAVIATHLYGAEALRGVRERYSLRIPCSSVLTDYTVIPFFAEAPMDIVFVPHEEIKRELAAKGVKLTCIVDGIAMSGGKGEMSGVLFGAMSYRIIDKIIVALKMDSLINDTIKGVILIVAILVQTSGPALKQRLKR